MANEDERTLVSAKDLPPGIDDKLSDKDNARHRAVIETVKQMRAQFPNLSADGMLKHVLGAATAHALDQIDELTRRIAEIENKPVLRYLGVWEQQRQYNEQNVVTCEGGMWVCRTATRSRPGSDSTWQLAVKRGRNGKGAK